MTISVSQLAHAVNTCTRIVPVHVVHCTVLGQESWVLHTMKDPVRLVFPCKWYTSQEAIAEYCNRNELDPQNVITQIEEE